MGRLAIEFRHSRIVESLSNLCGDMAEGRVKRFGVGIFPTVNYLAIAQENASQIDQIRFIGNLERVFALVGIADNLQTPLEGIVAALCVLNHPHNIFGYPLLNRAAKVNVFHISDRWKTGKVCKKQLAVSHPNCQLFLGFNDKGIDLPTQPPSFVAIDPQPKKGDRKKQRLENWESL